MDLKSQILADSAALVGAGAGVFTALVGGLFLRFKKRQADAARAREVNDILGHAKREADSLLREARLSANEEALCLRRETEESFSSQRNELAERQKGLDA